MARAAVRAVLRARVQARVQALARGEAGLAAPTHSDSAAPRIPLLLPAWLWRVARPLLPAHRWRRPPCQRPLPVLRVPARAMRRGLPERRALPVLRGQVDLPVGLPIDRAQAIPPLLPPVRHPLRGLLQVRPAQHQEQHDRTSVPVQRLSPGRAPAVTLVIAPAPALATTAGVVPATAQETATGHRYRSIGPRVRGRSGREGLKRGVQARRRSPTTRWCDPRSGRWPPAITPL